MVNRRLTGILVLAAALLAFGVLAHQHGEEEAEASTEQIIGSAKIGLGEAVAAAVAAHPGHAVEAELEGEIDEGVTVVVYEVEIIDAAGGVHEVMIDPADGRVLGAEREDDEDDEEEAAEHQGFKEVLKAAKLDLGACIRLTESRCEGRAYAAEMEMDDGLPVCEVACLAGETWYEIEIDLRNGEIVEIERCQPDDDDDDDDEDDDDEDDDDEHHHHGDDD